MSRLGLLLILLLFFCVNRLFASIAECATSINKSDSTSYGEVLPLPDLPPNYHSPISTYVLEGYTTAKYSSRTRRMHRQFARKPVNMQDYHIIEFILSENGKLPLNFPNQVLRKSILLLPL